MQKLIFLILIRPKIRPFYCTIRGYPYFLNAHRVLPSINPEHRASTSTALDTKPEHRAGKKHRASSEHRASMCSEASLCGTFLAHLQPMCKLLDTISHYSTYFLVMSQVGKSRVQASLSLKKSSLIESES